MTRGDAQGLGALHDQQRSQVPDVSLVRLGLSCLLLLVEHATLKPHQPVDKVDQVQVGQLAVEALDLEVDMSREL